jgi:hypothetical protein
MIRLSGAFLVILIGATVIGLACAGVPTSKEVRTYGSWEFVLMKRWETDEYVLTLITTELGLAAVVDWLQRYYRTPVPSQEVGAVIPECTLYFGVRMGSTFHRLERIDVYGELDRSGKRALDKPSLDVLFGIFRRWGNPVDTDTVNLLEE